MKIYFYSCKKNINTYLLINEALKEALLIDPCDIPEYFIKKLENGGYTLKGVCITNPSIEEIKYGVKTWQNVYDFAIFNPSTSSKSNINDSKVIQFSSFKIEVFCIKSSIRKFCMYKIENALFTGQSLLTSIFQFSSSNEVVIKNKMKDFDEYTIIFPLSGPPTALKNLKERELKQNLNEKYCTLTNVM